MPFWNLNRQSWAKAEPTIRDSGFATCCHGPGAEHKCCGCIDENGVVQRCLDTKRPGHRNGEKRQERGSSQGDLAREYSENEANTQQQFSYSRHDGQSRDQSAGQEAIDLCGVSYEVRP